LARCSASDSAIRSYEEIAAEVLAEAARIDAAEDERYGAARGDELPGQLASRGGRRAWLRDAKRRLELERAAQPEPVPKDRERRLEICHGRLVEDWRAEHQANRAYEAYRARGVMKDGRRFGCPPNPYEPSELPGGKINTTDPDARRMKFGRNFIPAYNAQAAVTEEQIIVAAEITTEGGDFEQLEPIVSAAERALSEAGVKERPEVVLADAGYWSNDHIDSLRERGLVPIVAPDTTRNRPRKTRLGGPLRLHAKSARHRARWRALLTKAGDGGAGLRPDQGEPTDRTLQTKRPGRRRLGMAPDRGYPQPPEAPPTQVGSRSGLSRGSKALAVSRSWLDEPG
jgi:Transposase DDE domain